MTMTRILTLIGAGLTLAACSGYGPSQWGSAPAKWDHPQMSTQQQQADQAECRQRANFQTEREMEREGPFASEQRNDQLQQMFDRHDQTARLRQIYENCLRDKGYAPVVLEGK